MNNFIKNTAILFTGVLVLSGCATYKFEYGKPPLDKGYVASRDDRVLLEYTLGKDNSTPSIKLAKERFKRRKRIVEDYYKRMGVIQNHFTMTIWEPTITFWKMVGGVFRLPFIAISDYRYEHNPKYRERVRNLEAGQDLREAERLKKLKDKLGKYVQDDLARESLHAGEQAEQRIAQEEAVEAKLIEQKYSEQKVPEAEKPQLQEAKSSKEEKRPEIAKERIPKSKKKQIQAQGLSQEQGLKTVIVAKPAKGYSPLRVQFNARQSTSAYGRIVSYHWDFGDGDVSIKPKPVNTYWSTTYGSKYFTAVLTVKDEKGNTGTSNITIEVLTK